MTEEKKDKQKERLFRIAKYLLSEGKQKPKPTEEQLWAYALGILDPEEENILMNLIADSESAQQSLSKMRDAISEASAVARTQADVLKEVEERPIEAEQKAVWAIASKSGILMNAREKARQVLDAMGKGLSYIAAIIVGTENGIAPAFVRADCIGHGQIPGMLRSRDEGTESSPFMPSYDLETPDGVKLTIMNDPESDEWFNIQAEVVKSPFEGHVRLLKLEVLKGSIKEEETGIVRNLRESKALLKRCPYGLVKIVVPGERSLMMNVERIHG